MHGINRRAAIKNGFHNFLEIMFNFWGALFGWMSAYLLLFHRVIPMIKQSGLNLVLSDFILAFISFISISGFLPFILMENAAKIKKVAEYARVKLG